MAKQMTGGARIVALTLTLAVSAFVSGCSDGQKALSNAAFITQGNEICRERTATLEKIESESTEGSGEIDEAARQRYREAAARGTATLLDLDPPVEFAADWERLKELQEELQEAANERIPEPDIAERIGPETNAILDRLSLTDCL